MAAIRKVILLIENSREYGRGLLRGIAKYASLHGPWSFYREESLFYQKPDQDGLLSLLKSREVDGIIMRETENVDEFIHSGIPVIIAPYTRKTFPGIPKIMVDCRQVGILAAEHLLSRGFHYFAFCGFDDMFWSRERGEGFAERIRKSGFTTNLYPSPQFNGPWSWNREQDYLVKWLKSLPRPVGLMACNDDRSQHVIEACKIAGLHIPSDVGIVGVGNDEFICGFSNPPLSSVARNHEMAGYQAAELLEKMMSGKKVTEQTIYVRPTYVVARRSTDIMAIEDRSVAEALQFINEHVREKISVKDVAEAAGLSRWALYQKFAQAIGSSPYEEIVRVRMEHVARMLVETNLSVAQIAAAFGDTNDKHLSRCFRRIKGISPAQYRRQYGK